jgi:prefoldin alpha subunit
MATKEEQRKEQKELQQKMLAYRILESRIDSLLKQREFLANKLVDAQTTLESIDEIEKSKEDVLFPLGSAAYTFGRIVDKNKMIVEVGAGVAIEKNFIEARDILNERKNDVENVLTTVQRNIQETSESLQMLEPQIQEMIQKQQSQSQEAG